MGKYYLVFFGLLITMCIFFYRQVMEGLFGSPNWKMSLNFKGLCHDLGNVISKQQTQQCVVLVSSFSELQLIACTWKASVGIKSRFHLCELSF